jgi:hypothetical protein
MEFESLSLGLRQETLQTLNIGESAFILQRTPFACVIVETQTDVLAIVALDKILTK